MTARSTETAWRRRTTAAVALLLLVVISASAVWQTGLAQTPPAVEPLVIVNDDEEQPFIERKKQGEFRARPIFSQRLSKLTYGIRDGDTGEWLTAIYRINGGEDERDEGWEYDFDYPALDEQPDLDPERTYLLVLAAQAVSHAEPTTFYVTIPEHQPGGIFNKILGALNPSRWARAAAVWVIEGVHGALCGLLEQFSEVGLDECER